MTLTATEASLGQQEGTGAGGATIDSLARNPLSAVDEFTLAVEHHFDIAENWREITTSLSLASSRIWNEEIACAPKPRTGCPPLVTIWRCDLTSAGL